MKKEHPAGLFRKALKITFDCFVDDVMGNQSKHCQTWTIHVSAPVNENNSTDAISDVPVLGVKTDSTTQLYIQSYKSW